MAKILEHNPFQDLLSKQGIAPLEAMAWTKQNAQSIRISLPKESDPNENRISLSPQAVALLTNNGHEIVIEKGAGERAGFSDSDYLLAGASVSEDVAMIWQSALTLKITPPSIAEIARMKEGQAFISSASYQHLSAELIDAMNAKKLMAIGLEFVEDNGGGFPFIKIMAEIAGQLILPIATDLIQKKNGLLLGHVTGVPPCNLVLLGAGQVVEQVARAAAHRLLGSGPVRVGIPQQQRTWSGSAARWLSHSRSATIFSSVSLMRKSSSMSPALREPCRCRSIGRPWRRPP